MSMGESMPAADLDFDDDFPASPEPRRRQKPAGVSPPAPILGPEPASRTWIYWTLGLSAAAGGAAWYMHDALDKAEPPKRNTDVFSDEWIDLRGMRRLALRLVLPALPAAALALSACHPGETAPAERYVAVKLNDSLSRFDSVEVLILSASDTSQLVGRVWAGPLVQPVEIPDYRLQAGENRDLSVRVRAWDAEGRLELDQLIINEDGKQTVISLPIPARTSDKPAASAALKSLVLSPVGLTPIFDSAREDYTANLAYEQGSVTLMAVPVTDTAEIRLEGAKLAAGVLSEPVDLLVGENEISIRVTVGDSSRLYSVGITRAPRIVLPDTTKPDTVKPDTVKPDTSHPPVPVKGWKYLASVDVNVHSLGMAQGSGVRNFPLLVRLDKKNFNFSEAAGDGRDLRFALQGKLLEHEIARWDTAAEKAEVWVRIDTIRGDTAFTPLQMYWGNAFAAPVSNAAKVFTPSAGHNAVWHLNENGRGDAGEFKDATGRYSGTGDGGDAPKGPRRVDGVVGHGQSFMSYGKGNGISVPRAFDPGDKWSFQGWVRADGTTSGFIFAKVDLPSASEMRFALELENGVRLALRRVGADYVTNVYLPKGNFVHLGVVYDGSSGLLLRRRISSRYLHTLDAGHRCRGRGLHRGRREHRSPLSLHRKPGRNLVRLGNSFRGLDAVDLREPARRRLPGGGQSGINFAGPRRPDPGHPGLRAIPPQIAMRAGSRIPPIPAAAGLYYRSPMPSGCPGENIMRYSALSLPAALSLAAMAALAAAPGVRAQPAVPIKWGAIGNSITEGSGYPAKLGTLLGPAYAVTNYGVSATTLLKQSNYSYWQYGRLSQVFSARPDIISVKLGTNDSKPVNWPTGKTRFLADLRAMVDTLARISTKPETFLCYPVPVFQKNGQWSVDGINDPVIKNEIMPFIKQVSEEKRTGLIDLHTPLESRGDLFSGDGVHPDAGKAGGDSIAALIYRAYKAQAIRVACIGNSITDNSHDGAAYPVKFNQLLGSDYYVFNAGLSGCTLLRKGDTPYDKTTWFQQVFDFKPDIITIKLGTNDSKTQNWDAHKNEFVADLRWTWTPSARSSPSPASSCSPPSRPGKSRTAPRPSASAAPSSRTRSSPRSGRWPPEKGLAVIDLHTPFQPYQSLTPDGVHPNAVGPGHPGPYPLPRLQGDPGIHPGTGRPGNPGAHPAHSPGLPGSPSNPLAPWGTDASGRRRD